MSYMTRSQHMLMYMYTTWSTVVDDQWHLKVKLSNSLLWSNSDREFNPVGEKKRKIEKKLQYTAWKKKRKTCSQVALPWQRKGKRSVSKKDNFGHFFCQMPSTFRLLIGWTDDSCSQTNVGKELLRNFSFWALGPRTIDVKRDALIF